MARKIRVEYPGAVYHVMNRGDRKESIFRDDEDRRRFLATLGEAVRLRAETVMTVNWIAARLRMGTPG